MKKLVYLFLLFAIIAKAQIQPDPAHWAYGLKKMNGDNYELHLRCTIDDGWHIYAQKQGKDFIGTRTKIVLQKQTGVAVVGKPAEVGRKDTYVAKEVGITNFEYAGVVDFVQSVKIKPGPTDIKGTITYQTCTHERCLLEKTISFTVPVPDNH